MSLAPAVPSEAAYLYSSFYEQLVEHVFISEVLQECWYTFHEQVEVLRSEVDSSGYDIVLECRGVLRHIQLKTSAPTAKTSQQKVNTALADKPSGCVVWMFRHYDPEERRMRLKYRFFGAEPGCPLPSLEAFKVGRHTKGNASGFKAERPAIRVIPKGRFDRIATTRALVCRLFGFPTKHD